MGHDEVSNSTVVVVTLLCASILCGMLYHCISVLTTSKPDDAEVIPEALRVIALVVLTAELVCIPLLWVYGILRFLFEDKGTEDFLGSYLFQKELSTSFIPLATANTITPSLRLSSGDIASKPMSLSQVQSLSTSTDCLAMSDIIEHFDPNHSSNESPKKTIAPQDGASDHLSIQPYGSGQSPSILQPQETTFIHNWCLFYCSKDPEFASQILKLDTSFRNIAVDAVAQILHIVHSTPSDLSSQRSKICTFWDILAVLGVQPPVLKKIIDSCQESPELIRLRNERLSKENELQEALKQVETLKLHLHNYNTEILLLDHRSWFTDATFFTGL